MAYCLEQIGENARQIRRKIELAAGGRKVFFLAACKGQAPGIIAACREFDFDFFGENRAQELEGNLEAGAYGQRPVHFIGRLQSRKAALVTGKCALIHSVDSEKLFSLIDARAEKLGAAQDILLEINIGGESAKGGVSPSEAERLLDRAGAYPRLRVRGMMAIPPKCADFNENMRNFQTLYKLFIDINEKKYDNVNMDILSMGMSGDFELAVRCGSNLVRVGSALFGARE